MTQAEYKQKKQECWEEYVNLLNHNSAARYVFDKIFDRAYALGKLQASCRQVKETITQEEIEKLAKEFAERECEIGQVDRDALYKGYYHGMKDSLGKQEKEMEKTVISGWVARHDNGPNDLGLRIYTVKPKRMDGLKRWNGRGKKTVLIDHRLFPDLTWESDPEPVEIIIKRKKNG